MLSSRLALAALAVSSFAACHHDPNTGGNNNPDGAVGSDADPNGTAAFEIKSPDIMLPAGTEVTYCYYFHTPNTSALNINKWVSAMTPGSHHMIMFFNNGSQPADGTIDTNGCGVGGTGTNIPIWVYAAQTQTAELDLPADDGAGKPLAMAIPAGQAAYFQMHYLNASNGPLTVHVDLKAYALAAGTAFTQTDAFITYNANISIPPHAVNLTQSMTCNVPSGAKFWTVSTHSHKQSIATDLKDGTAMVFSSTDWEHPGAMSWMTAPFYTFTSGQMTYECTYDNNGQTAPPDNENNTIVSGPSAQTNEMCMGTGYYFPATTPKFCYNNLSL